MMGWNSKRKRRARLKKGQTHSIYFIYSDDPNRIRSDGNKVYSDLRKSLGLVINANNSWRTGSDRSILYIVIKTNYRKGLLKKPNLLISIINRVLYYVREEV